MLQPAEGRYKVYILDEAHQLTDAAWNALLKLIEEPPPHLVFVFCTTDLSKVLPTVRSRCQTFVFPRPRLPELVRKLRRDRRRRGDRRARRRALADRPLRARGVPRRRVDARPALGRRPRATITVQAVLQLLGAVEEEALFRLLDLVVDRDTAGALTFIEELVGAGTGSRPARHRPARAPAPPPARPAHGRGARLAARDRGDARAAARAGEPARRGDRAPADRPAARRGRGHAPGRRPAPAARARARQGDAARARTSRASRSPTGSSSWSSAARRRPRHGPGARHRGTARTADGRCGRATPAPRRRRSSSSSSRRRGSARSCPPSRSARSRPRRCCARRARELADDPLTLEFPASAAFHRKLAEEPKNATLLARRSTR